MAPNVLIVHPDLSLAARLQQLILSRSDASVDFEDSVQGGIEALQGYTHLDLCVCDVNYPKENGAPLFAAVQTRFPRARVIAVTHSNMQELHAPLPDFTVLSMPQDEAHFIALCHETLASLEGGEIPPFRLGAKFLSDRWGDWYEGYDTSLKREVFIIVIHSWATPEESAQFRDSAMLRARAAHINVQAVYVAGRHQDRDFVCHEKWAMPSLADFAESSRKIDARLAAQILHTVGSVLIFWDVHGYPHPAIDATDVSISPQGVIKVTNKVDPALPITPARLTDMVAVAAVVRALLPSLEQVPLRLQELLDTIRDSEQVTLETTMGDITIKLNSARAPLTVANFLAYVDSNAYDGAIFHHVIPDFVVQGGRFRPEMSTIPTAAPIPNEASSHGLPNVRGTIAMTQGRQPNSITSQFVFNLADNMSLNGSLNKPGYVVFGKVVKGLDILDRMAQARTTKKGIHHHVPAEPIAILKARRTDSIPLTRMVDEAQVIDIQSTAQPGGKAVRLSGMIRWKPARKAF